MQSIARQMSEGNFLVRAPTRSTDEIGTLGRSLNVLAARQREKIQDLEQERAKVTAILDGMVEGVVAVDDHEHILLMNERARVIFGLGSARGEKKPFLEVIRNAELHEVFRASRTGAPDAVVRREVNLTAARRPRVAGTRAAARAGQRRARAWSWCSTTSPSCAGSSRCARSSSPTCPTSCARRSPPSTATSRRCSAARSRSRSTRAGSSRSSFATPSGSAG